MANLLKKTYARFKLKRAQEFFEEIKPYLKNTKTVLDIGSGSCLLTEILDRQGFSAQAIDIKNKSLSKAVIPIIFDGKKIPFKSKTFDVAILSFVLHHSKDPQNLLRETARVANKIIVREITPKNWFEKIIILIVDAISQKDLFPNILNDKSWREIFTEFDLTIIESRSPVCNDSECSLYYLKPNT